MTRAEHAIWNDLIQAGISNGVSGISMMVGRDMKLVSLKPRRVHVKDVADLIGGPEQYSVGVHLSVSGAARGHLMLAYSPQTAFNLVDILLDVPAGTTQDLGEMERSTIGEMGNIMGSFFLNALADRTGLDLRPSPPAVMMDMLGAILNVALIEIMMESDEVIVADTTFGTADRVVAGTFLIMPSPELFEALVKSWSAA